VLSLLRQRRYLGLIAFCTFLAMVFTLAGVWQVVRFDQKHRANHELRANNKDTPENIADVLGPATAQTTDGKAQEFRHVTATGSYLPAYQNLVLGASVDSGAAFTVLTPLQTRDGVLLVARGLIAATGASTVTPSVPAPPTVQVTVTVRLEGASNSDDKYAELPRGQVDLVNATQQAQRVGQPVWNAYGDLLDGEPGTAGLQVIPSPDMSNPAGGAVEPQHAAYFVQWFLFALGALAVPFGMARAELRRTQQSKKPSLDDRLAGNA